MSETVFAFDPATHRYTLNGVTIPGLTKTLELTGFVNSKWFTQESRDRGTAVHQACQFYAEGDLDENTVVESIRPRVEQFKRFWDDMKPRLVLAEKPLYSALFRFGATPDMVLEVRGEIWLVDIKTGVSGLAAQLQTAGQKVALEEREGIEISKRFVLELPGEGKYKLIPHANQADTLMVLNAVAMVHRRINEGELKI